LQIFHIILQNLTKYFFELQKATNKFEVSMLNMPDGGFYLHIYLHILLALAAYFSAFFAYFI